MKSKTIEAWLRGYFLFRVNGRIYFTYAEAHKARQKITEGNLAFDGLHCIKSLRHGWIGFFHRLEGARLHKALGESGQSS